MATLSAKRIREALKKAQRVGQIEDRFVLAGVPVVLETLPPGAYERILEEIKDREDLAYLNGYRDEHLCRAIVEVGDLDFRESPYVEVEVEEENKKTHQLETRTIKLEKHEFIRDYILTTWSREAVDVAFRKFNDLVAQSEQAAAEGIRFVTPNETADEKYRRLLGELREIEGQLPIDLATRLLVEHGYLKKAAVEDVAAAEDRLGKIAQEGPSSPAQEPEPQAPTQVVERRQEPPPEPAWQPAEARVASVPSDEELMRIRRPLNQEVPVAPPAQVRPPRASHIPAEVEAHNRAQSALYDRLESDPGFVEDPSVARRPTVSVPELSEPQSKLDPGKLAASLDQPPTGGLNPRFRPRPKL